MRTRSNGVVHIEPKTAHLVCVVLLFACIGCKGDPVEVEDELGPVGAGIVRVDGTERDYALDEESSVFDVLLGPSFTGTPCAGYATYHVVQAHGLRMAFAIDDPSESSTTAHVIVPVAQLVIDDEEARLRYPQTADYPEEDRVWLGEEMRNEELNVAEFPEMTFDLLDVDGELFASQSGTVRATMKGTTSEFALDYVVTEEGDALVINATGTLDGRHHDFPTGFVGRCIDPEMDLFLRFVLRPGVQPQP